MKKHRLPSEFGGDIQMTEREKQNWRIVAYCIIGLWIFTMVLTALQ